MARGLGRGLEANCFEPHHLLCVGGPTGTVDLVICFACGEVEVYRGEEHLRWIVTDETAESTFARYLGPTPLEEGRW